MKKENNSLHFLKEHKQTLNQYFEQLLLEYSSNYKMHFWAKGSFTYLHDFLLNGKSVRGGLILELLRIIDPSVYLKEEALALAALVEFVHAGLLIQDDFMDNDRQRRGMDSLYYQLEKHANKRHFANPYLFGVSLATCVSDLCFFIGFGELVKLYRSPGVLRQVQQLSTQEYLHVGLAQMRDTQLGYLKNGTTLAEIENIYRYKTARYTFSFPFSLAAVYSGFSEKEQRLLELIGEKIGLIFQLRDDYLSIFGDSQKTGKPIGSDIIENKKTIYRELLFGAIAKSSLKKYQKIPALFGGKALPKKKLALIQEAMLTLGVQKAIEVKTAHYSQEIEWLLEYGSLSRELKTFLSSLTIFIATRNK